MPVIHKVLVANRGEIAVRIIRTCQRLGIETVLAASTADRQSLAARMADRVVCIGPAPATQSYLNVEAVMQAASLAEVDALHPGYGFLSENRLLAKACEEAGIIFIGPTVTQLEALGDKLKARRHAMDAGLPVVPGGDISNLDQARRLVEQIGWPVLIKAVGGGGGRGMKRVSSESELAQGIPLAIAEARAAFADERIYLERYVESGRHVEVQILGDAEQVVHLGTRDCSIQRRYQKLVEEAPAPSLPDSVREQMHQAAVRFAQHLKYKGLGTVELLFDCQRNQFYFLEMNARIQVEHPVTEMICGMDLVAEQIRVAQGCLLALQQSDVHLQGHAMECRINAEDWLQDFAPMPGQVTQVTLPVAPWLRVDTHLQAGATVPPFYDSLIAKLIVHGRDRTEALARMQWALSQCDFAGITCNLPMHQALFQESQMQAGGYDTGYLPEFLQRKCSTRAMP